MMDLGATVCTPRNPACAICPLIALCAGRAAGLAAGLPRRAAKGEKPVRRGIAYVARRADGALLLERRPNRGLLGGMLGWPGTGWTTEPPTDLPPVAAGWIEAQTPVRHTFTHFHLILTVRTAEVPWGANAERGFFLPPAEFRPADLPTVMRKVHDVAFGSFGAIERKRRGG
jgi:A/G-specific adenine glycosylase